MGHHLVPYTVYTFSWHGLCNTYYGYTAIYCSICIVRLDLYSEGYTVIPTYICMQERFKIQLTSTVFGLKLSIVNNRITKYFITRFYNISYIYISTIRWDTSISISITI